MLISSSEWVLGDRPTALRRSVAAGFGAIELDAVPGADLAPLRDELAAAQLEVPSLCWSWNKENELGSPDARSRAAAQKYLLDSLEQAHELGATQLVVLPACRNEPWADEPRIRGFERAAASISAVLPDAPADVTLALEGLRREESFLMNTLDHSSLLRSMIGSDDRVGLLADWYHLVFEEVDPIAALREHAEEITLVHLAATARGPLLASSTGAAELVEQLRVMPAVQSYTLEFLVGDDDVALADSLAFAASV
jgi:sugar phosphate isomerase/epimerase